MLKFIGRRIIQNIAALAALGALFFILAGTIRVWGFWVYVATVLGYQIISLLIIVPKHPEYIELANVRKTAHTDAKKWDRVVVLAVLGATYVMYALAAFDVGRLHVSQLPVLLTVVGIVAYVVASALNQWAMLHNPHFEREVRIQTDRNHVVMTGGPYRYVRHPGYLGSVVGFVSFPLVVGSGIALLGSVLCIAGMIVRTYLEDGTLSQELAGYAEYARTVRYRLLPYVW
ncbi:MAG TPA: isoprenylcysteine carboxylmethyltransferase family protein [Anaerolineae bacterium]|nr:isoprenylcysteine carboxylmethyltransferase family protein [Anaerolineae bacterium]HQI83345.1 isoprenylcysteine carboxylmethyltransferase family protein [Anaerolineae bacterium]